MLEATEDATEALGSFTKPSEDELDDIKQQLRQEKMQKMMEKQRQSRWGNNNRGFDQGFGNFGMPERFNGYDKRGNYGPKDSRFNQAPDFDMRDMYYGNGRY